MKFYISIEIVLKKLPYGEYKKVLALTYTFKFDYIKKYSYLKLIKKNCILRKKITRATHLTCYLRFDI